MSLRDRQRNAEVWRERERRRHGELLREMLQMPQEPGDGRPRWFTRADELRERTTEKPDWTVDGYLAPGAITLLAGKPKAGKSTLAWAIAEAVSAGSSSFLGRGLQGGPVVYVSEEGLGTLRHKLPDSPSIWVMTREIWPKPSWAELVGAAVAEAWHRDALILVVDALGFWAGLAASEENKSGAVQAVMEELLRATDIGLAVLLVHHQRKGGGKDGDAGARLERDRGRRRCAGRARTAR